jgi:hypothetical protein
MSNVKSLPRNTAEDPEQVCPFLGLPEDSQTSLAYPSSWNVCHHTRPPATPNLDFQQSFCFCEDYITCPIYSRVGREPLPVAIRFPVSQPPFYKRTIFQLMIGAVLLLFGILGTLWGINDNRSHGGNPALATASSTPSITKLVLPTHTIPFTDTPVPPTLTSTPTLTLTSTPTGSTIHPTDTLWPSLTLTPTSTSMPTHTATGLPQPTATFIPTWTPRPTDTHWLSLTPTITR